MRISDWSSDVCSSDLHKRGAAEFGRGAADLVLLDDMRLALVPGVAAAQRDAELIGQIIGEIAVERRSLGAHVARGIAVEPRQPDQIAGQPQQHVERGLRSEEHTSELQSLMRNSYAVFCLKKKNNKT